MDRIRIGSLVAFALSFFWGPLCAHGAIQIDGRLVEAEWQAARRFDEFLTADPLSLEKPAYHTEARVLPQPDGLYIGIVAQAPRELRTHGQSPRDPQVFDADVVRIVVDFEGRGKSAYEFAVSLSNSYRDGIFLNQTQVSYDWDGAWQHEVSEDDDNWYVEVFIPWSVAQLPVTRDDTRTIGLWFLRSIRRLNRGFAFPAIEAVRPTFVADLHRMEVPGYAVQVLDWFPYAAASFDRLNERDKGRAGVDLFWKPDAQKQLSITVNPDFGQVESDNLVVNFTAIETFFSEKRPFFTEGQSLFDVRTTNEGRFINTRRIGAAPDVGPEGVTDILAAAKFTGLSGPLEYGAFGAVEDDSSQAQGRTFAATRLRYKADSTAIGYLGTFTHHPTLDRDAQVHLVDANWVGHAGLSLDGQFIGTFIEQGTGAFTPFVARENTQGLGTVLRASYSPGGLLQQDVNLTWFDRHFDIDDLGYLQRGNFRELQSVTQLHTRQYPETSPLNAAYWRINGRLKYNDFGDRLPATFELGRYWRFREPLAIYAYYFGQASGIDDLLTFGGPKVKLPSRHEWSVQYQVDLNRKLSVGGQVFALQEGVDGTAYRFDVRPTYIVTERLTLGLEVIYIDSPDWLIWRPAQQRLASYDRQQLYTQFTLNWYPAPRQELRIKAQWIALRADAQQTYAIGPNANLATDAAPVDDLNIGQAGLQVRYRYELKPLSDLYIVYSRGGFATDDQYPGRLGGLFNVALDEKTADLMLVKLRYRF